MLLVAAQDEGRLSRDPRLINLFQVLPILPPMPSLNFVRSIEAINDDIVLFWHEDAFLALQALGDVQRQNLWPNNLLGVVIFRAAHFAGLGNRATADAALDRFGLDRKRVHILKPPVTSAISVDLTNSIQNFSTSLAGEKPTYPPFGFLQPAGQNDAALTLLFIDWLNRIDPELGNQLMKRAYWQRIGQNLNIDIDEVPSLATIATAASRIRVPSIGCVEECSLCGWRHKLFHEAETLAREGFPADERRARLPSTVEQAVALLAVSRTLEDEVLSPTIKALLVDDLGVAGAPLREILRKQLQDQCRLERDLKDELTRIQSVLQRERSDVELRQAAQDVATTLRCDAFLGFRF